jgi:hypothetical protein
MSMPVITLAYAGSMLLLGFVPYLITGQKTALIPAGFGVLAAIAGSLAFKDSIRKHAMHGAAMLGLLGVVLPLGRLIPAVASGKMPSPLALFSLSTMAVISTIFLCLCIRSFIQARKARRLAESATDNSNGTA